jgi:hypothetical protein
VSDLLGEEGVQATAPIPSQLAELAAEIQLLDEDVQMLARIRFRGRWPRTKDDWRFLWESIRRSVWLRTV